MIRRWIALLALLAALLLALQGYSMCPFTATRSVSLRDALDPFHGSMLSPLLRPRVAGTPGGRAARQHIINELKNVNWDAQALPFVATTPHGPVEMANVVASLPSLGGRHKVTLAAHYDSKLRPKGFIGAIDSAFPCALLLWLASQTQHRNPSISFDLIFFDGEEAFQEWTEQDSLYGARHLAAEQQANHTLPETLVLLDLLGHEQWFPIASWFPETEKMHSELSKINPILVGGRDLHAYAGQMLDDHIPYWNRGVPCLHLIPAHFPEVWHTMEDNADILDWDTMEAWAKLFETWLFERTK